MWGTVLSIGGSVLGGMMSSDAAEEGAETSAAATKEAAGIPLKMYRETASRLQPWVSTGTDALRMLAYRTGVGSSTGGTSAPTGGAGAGVGAGGKTLDQITQELRASGRFSTGGNLNNAFSRPSMADLQGEDHLAALRRMGEFNRFVEGNLGDWMTPGSMAGAATAGGVNEKALMDEAQRLFDAQHDAQQVSSGPPSGSDPSQFGDLTKPYKDFSFTLEDFMVDPSYNFRKAEGEKALTRGAAARGLAQSTPGLKDLARFNQDLASTEYGAAYGRATNEYSMGYTKDSADKQRVFDYLSYLSGSGQNAAAQVGVAGGNAGAVSAGLTAQAGQIAGQGQINSAALMSNGISTGVGNYMYQKRYDDMMSRMPVFGQSTPGNLSSGTFGLGAGP